MPPQSKNTALAKAMHTPGPWTFKETIKRTNFDGALIYVRNAEGFIVAAVPYDNRLPMEANACLIAASPQLLEALEALITAVGEWLIETAPGNAPHPVVMAHESAYTAIAVAKGES